MAIRSNCWLEPRSGPINIVVNIEFDVRAAQFDRKVMVSATSFRKRASDFETQAADLSSPNCANRITNARSL